MYQTVTSVLLAASCLLGGGIYLIQAEFAQSKVALTAQLNKIKEAQSKWQMPDWNRPTGRHMQYNWTQV